MSSRLPLRLRVTLAFAAASVIVLTVLGGFVQLRVSDGLEEHLRDTLGSELDALLAAPASQREEIVLRSHGETFLQVGSERSVSSPQLRTDLRDAPAGFSDRVVRLADDEGTEAESCLILVRRADGQQIIVGTSRAEAEAALSSVRRQLLLGVPMALLLASGLGYAVAGAGLRPIERMRARAAGISARDPSERLPLPEAHDELQRLGVTLNAMLDRLEEGLQRERRFVAEASHELRTPLALMRTELDLALSRPRSPDELRAALRSAMEETDRLSALAEDLLTMAAAGSSAPSLHLAQVDLVELASTVGARFTSAAGQAGRRVLVDAGPQPIPVTGDRSRLERALSNLVDNALRHGAGDVVVAVSVQGGNALLAVSDQGSGFGADARAQGDAFAQRGRGAGLGLSIARALAEAHGGTLTLTSRGTGGAMATIALPGPGNDRWR